MEDIKKVTKLTIEKLGMSAIPSTLALYGLYRSSWHIRRILEAGLYREECHKYGHPYTMTKYGFGMHLNPRDKGFSRNILWGKRESFAAEYLCEFLNPQEVCFDIGANIGYYVNIEQQCCKEGEIYAFEPVSDTFKILKKNLPPRARAYKVAIGDFVGDTHINVDSNRNLSTITNNPRNAGVEAITCTTIDTWVKQRSIIPTFLRMDTEGYEVKILRGAKNLIQSKVPLKIFMETHPTLAGKASTNMMLETLYKNGFSIQKIFLWNTFSDSPLSPLHDKWLKVQTQLEGANIDCYGEVPPTMSALKELNKRGIGCHLFLSRGEK